MAEFTLPAPRLPRFRRAVRNDRGRHGNLDAAGGREGVADGGLKRIGVGGAGIIDADFAIGIEPVFLGMVGAGLNLRLRGLDDAGEVGEGFGELLGEVGAVERVFASDAGGATDEDEPLGLQERGAGEAWGNWAVAGGVAVGCDMPRVVDGDAWGDGGEAVDDEVCAGVSDARGGGDFLVEEIGVAVPLGEG